MSFVTVGPQLLAGAAADVTAIGSVIDSAGAAAAGWTTGLLPAAFDEVSQATAALFGEYAQTFQAILKQGTAFHDDFAAALTTAWRAYTQTELANSAADVTLAMGGSGNPIPPMSYLNAVVTKYITPHFPTFTLANAQALFTPEAFYPLTGIKDLPPGVSVSEGLSILDYAIKAQLTAGNNVAVLGFSQSSIISSLEMRALNPSDTPSALPISFTLLGNPMNPNGGLLARFPGLSMPSLGFEFYGATPANSFPTNIYTIEYDGFADFPRYPLNILADLNALAGIYYVHGTYADLTPAQINSAIPLTNTVGPTTTNYYMIPNPRLPLLEPLRAIPMVGTPLADLFEPNMRVLVNLGYGSPDQGWSTTAPNVPTAFGLFPEVDALDVAGHLAVGTQQGVGAFAGHVDAALEPIRSPTGFSSSPTISLPPTGALERVVADPTRLVNAFSSAVSTGYSVLLPTADFLNAAVTSVPSYDINLFLDGILQAASGDPVGGLINAIGRPIAADVALFTIAGGFEVIVLVSAAQSIINDFASL